MRRKEARDPSPQQPALRIPPLPASQTGIPFAPLLFVARRYAKDGRPESVLKPIWRQRGGGLNMGPVIDIIAARILMLA
ncbi:hypothetical protein X765_14755 [Mesorhizobium sp. LSHC440B00]|nr:hypothetical protein X765_14755 [Mesorhizobium sp. LSHC440B00]